ncbi:HlyC/CorC family transporter [Pelistega europaea]|uniref:Magnesium and cobalt efflux protein CorC n=1 Tax=Pelistega europaea TaxID=106147 RepID=A0A7Y4P5Y4_9BURK|nr:transporter associated domain-containing protein [Pelistega europaea]NOL49349.1 CBS domain-containing protein [Pelistega europaea]
MSSEPYPSTDVKSNKSISRRISEKVKGLFSLQHEPEDREDINEILNTAHERGIIDQETHLMVLGAISFTEKIASDIMVSRSKMDCIDINQPIHELVPYIIETAHSRFPVYEEERDNIIGLLLAKDLLRYVVNPNQNLRDLVRPAYFVPETKTLKSLMQEFRTTRNHIAIVIDEYGSITGLVTMEDILEQIVGEIEDEYDEDAEQTIFPESDYSWRVMGITQIKHLNEALHSHLPEDEYDTLGGWLAAELDQIPKRGDTYAFEDLKFKVLRADEKRAQWIHIRRVPLTTPTDEQTSQ